jgi:hypothetical protein
MALEIFMVAIAMGHRELGAVSTAESVAHGCKKGLRMSLIWKDHLG